MIRCPSVLAEEIVETGTRFHVDVFGAGGQCVAEQPLALFLRTGECAAFPQSAGT